jgi:hypothetical protein
MPTRQRLVTVTVTEHRRISIMPLPVVVAGTPRLVPHQLPQVPPQQLLLPPPPPKQPKQAEGSKLSYETVKKICPIPTSAAVDMVLDLTRDSAKMLPCTRQACIIDPPTGPNFRSLEAPPPAAQQQQQQQQQASSTIPTEPIITTIIILAQQRHPHRHKQQQQQRRPTQQV